jgi:hypothetical protein
MNLKIRLESALSKSSCSAIKCHRQFISRAIESLGGKETGVNEPKNEPDVRPNG